MAIEALPFDSFEALDAGRLLPLAAIYFGAFAVKGAIGIGALTPSIVFGTFVIGAHHAVALALVASMLSQIQYIPHGVRHGDWTIARRLIVPNFTAAALGVWIFGRLEAPELTLLLGLSLGALVALDVTGAWTRLTERVDITRPGTMLTMSAVSGLISGTTGAGGLFFIAVYLRLVKPDRADFRATILLLSTLVIGWRAAVMLVAGHIDQQVLMQGLLLLPAIVLGGIFGTHGVKRISESRFTLILQVVVLFGACALIWRGLQGLWSAGA